MLQRVFSALFRLCLGIAIAMQFSPLFLDLQISNDAKVLADIIFDPDESKYRLVIWKDGNSSFEFVSVDSSINTFTMRGDGKELLVGTWAGELLLYNMEKSDLRRLAKAHIGTVHQILVSETTNLALTIAGVFNSRDRSLRLWDTKSGHLLTEYTPDVKVFPIEITNNGKWVIVEIRGKLVKLELLSK